MSGVEALFQPLRLRDLEVKNRIVMAPMTTRLPMRDGTVTEELIAYYEARARGGVGMVVLEMASPMAGGRHRAHELGLYDDRFLVGLRKLTERLKEHGAVAAVQIGHAGAYAAPWVTGQRPVAPSALPVPVHEVVTRKVTPEALTTEGIRRIVQAFGEAAERAQRAGFDAIEVHGAHGYLIGQFLSPLYNHRTDDYGGSPRNRARLALEVVRACRERVGEMPVLFRFSADEYVPGGFPPEEAPELARWAVEAGADVIDVSAGSYKSLPSAHVVMPPMSFPQGVFVPLAEVVKRAVDVPVVAVGRLHEPESAARVVAEGKADMIALGRALVADPEWANKAASGNAQDIRPCISCNTCVDTMRNGGMMTCLVNPEMGREAAFATRSQAAGPKRVLVVGGGPGGMEAAARLAERGHRVTLCEARERVGGEFLRASRAPLFQNVDPNPAVMGRLVTFLEERLARRGVEVRLGCRVDAATVRELGPEVAVLATGATYRAPFGWLVDRMVESQWARRPWAKRLMKRRWMQHILFRLIRKSDRGLARELERIGIPTHAIGDCREPGRTREAIRSAADLEV